MLLVILLVLLLAFVQAGVLAQYRINLVGFTELLGPRDDLPEAKSPRLGRAKRALDNLHETLPIFLTLAILSIVLNEEGTPSMIGAVVYLVARVLYVPSYLLALSPWRSVCFGVSVLGLAALALPVVSHVSLP